jgi:hypothetical protein
MLMGLIRQGGAGVATLSNTLPSITYRKLGLPVVVATSFAKQAFNSTSAHSIDRLNGLIDYPTQRL